MDKAYLKKILLEFINGTEKEYLEKYGYAEVFTKNEMYRDGFNHAFMVLRSNINKIK